MELFKREEEMHLSSCVPEEATVCTPLDVLQRRHEVAVEGAAAGEALHTVIGEYSHVGQ